MGATIRQASAADATKWLELVKAVLGDDHPAKQVYDAAWITNQLNPASGHETWVAENGGKLTASVTILAGGADDKGGHVMNLGRQLFRAEAATDGSAEALLKKLDETSAQKQQMIVARVLAADNPQQVLFEKQGYACVGFQPLKHMHRAREGVLFYVKAAQSKMTTRLPVSESLPQISELATVVLDQLQVRPPKTVRDGVTGYPLQSELAFQDTLMPEFLAKQREAEAANPPKEISGSFNMGHGYMRITVPSPLKAVIAQRDGKVVAGLAFLLDEMDRCVRVINSFCTDDLSLGAALHHVVKLAQSQLNAVYVELDILTTAPRLIKSAEQLGFVAVAYLPAFYSKDGGYTDVVKMVKFNLSYAPEAATVTAAAKRVLDIVELSLQDQKMGVAVINLLRALPIFEGLGDGELRKIARLFVQKLFRPKEKVFSKGDSGNEAFIVMRGQIDICLEDGGTAIASVGNGQIFGELAFLDGAARSAFAIANQATILLVVQRSAFNELVQREPHLGMVVMKNVASDLSNKLRRATTRK
ncbi:MAG: cyclic nucleotide-binding domain-containing protein [Verrucomicrobia bacterium]|nr:cyclic nucleotide-binding domain-containing protein [Verrucomicrobiota bacterium]